MFSKTPDPHAALKPYAGKVTTAALAISLLRNGDHVFLGTGCAVPRTLVHHLETMPVPPADLELLHFLTVKSFDKDAQGISNTRFRHRTFFVGVDMRHAVGDGRIEYVPISIARVPEMMARGRIAVDVALIQVSLPDAFGYVSLGVSVDIIAAALSVARLVIAEVNPHMPRTMGDTTVHLSRIHHLIAVDYPIAELDRVPAQAENVQRIAKYIARIIDDGSTLQIGYGGIPDAVVMQLTSKHDLGIHTEMIGDGIMSLVEAGVVTNRKKNFHPGKMFATFALGSKKLYQFMHRNPALEMHPVDFTNDPFLAAKNDNLHAINATMQIDFMGQCGSESLGHKPYSGTGGQSDFVRAANRSNGGKAFIVLPATAKDDTISRIVPSLSTGTHVSTSKNDINYVVTEFGVAQLRGKTAKQRCEALIGIAHPNFRAELRETAKKMKFL